MTNNHTIGTRVKELSDNSFLTLIGRLFTTFGIPILVVLVAWQLNKADATRDTISSKIDNLGDRMTKLEDKVDDLSRDPYHGADAKRDLALRDVLLKQIENHVEALDGRTQALELAAARRR